MYILGLNGPPRSGKDTLAKLFLEHMDSQGCTIPVIETTPTIQLYEIACALTGWKYDLRTYEEFKTTHFAIFQRDGRQLMIDVSESWLKPTYGNNIKAYMTLASLKDFTGLVVFTSLGFQEEADVFSESVGTNNLMVVRVERPGCSFANDSREWVDHKHVYHLQNNRGLDGLARDAESIYTCLKEFMGWKF